MAALAPWLWRGYVAALGDSLRSGRPPCDGDRGRVDAATRQTLAEVAARARTVGRAGAAALPPSMRRRRGRRHPEAIADLRSGDRGAFGAFSPRTRRAPALIPHVIPLLARDGLFAEVVATLRRSGALSIGQLLDAVLDPAQPAVVRRRVPRVLKAFPTPRAFEACSRPSRRCRSTCATGAGRRSADADREPRARAAPAAVFAAAARELDAAARGGRLLEHVFTLLALGLDREPLSTCLWALRYGDPALRGTALEYLDNVLPEPLKRSCGRTWATTAGQPRPLHGGDPRGPAAVDGGGGPPAPLTVRHPAAGEYAGKSARPQS